MEERKKKRKGKGLRLEIKAVIVENGTTMQVFLNYPRENFDRPENVIYHAFGFFKTLYPKLDLTNFVNFCSKYDSKESEFILKSITDSVIKRNGSGKL